MIDVVLFVVAIIVGAVIVACSIADARDDRKRDQILHMVWGFEYLMQRLGAE